MQSTQELRCVFSVKYTAKYILLHWSKSSVVRHTSTKEFWIKAIRSCHTFWLHPIRNSDRPMPNSQTGRLQLFPPHSTAHSVQDFNFFIIIICLCSLRFFLFVSFFVAEIFCSSSHLNEAALNRKDETSNPTVQYPPTAGPRKHFPCGGVIKQTYK